MNKILTAIAILMFTGVFLVFFVLIIDKLWFIHKEYGIRNWVKWYIIKWLK